MVSNLIYYLIRICQKNYPLIYETDNSIMVSDLIYHKFGISDQHCHTLLQAPFIAASKEMTMVFEEV